MTSRPHAWRQWFASLDLKIEDDMVGQRFDLFSMLSEAALQGMGVALISPFLIGNELRLGQLVQVVTHDFVSDRSYYLIHPETRSDHPPLRVFRDWLLQAAEQYRREEGLS